MRVSQNKLNPDVRVYGILLLNPWLQSLAVFWRAGGLGGACVGCSCSRTSFEVEKVRHSVFV